MEAGTVMGKSRVAGREGGVVAEENVESGESAIVRNM